MKDQVISFLKRNGLHGLSLLVFALLSASLLSKSYDGYSVRQGDIKNYLGMSKEANDHRILHGDVPAWTGAMFSGMPTTHITRKYSSWHIPRRFASIGVKTFQSSGVFFFFMAMASAYLLAIALGASAPIALLCGIGFGLSSFEVLYYSAGHNSKVKDIAYLPGIIAGVIWVYRKNLGLGLAIASLFTSLHVYSNHYQITYYALFILVAIGIVETIGVFKRTQNWKAALLPGVALLIAGLIGVLPSLSDVLETKDYAEATIRGEQILADGNVSEDLAKGESGLDRNYILEYSMSDGEWWSIMCADIKGGSSPMYWGEQKFSGGALYFGAILCALFFIFLIAGRDRLKWPLAAVTVMAILLSRRDGGFLTDFFLDYIPFFNQFRDTKMMLILVQVAVSIGTALALVEMGKLISNGGAELKKRRVWWMGGLGFLSLTFASFYVLPEFFFDFQTSIKQDVAVEQLGYPEALRRRLVIFQSDVARTLGLIVLTAGIVAAALWQKIAMRWAVLLLVMATALDLWNVDQRYFNDDKVNGVYRNWVKSFDARYPFDPTPQMGKVLAAEFKTSKEINTMADQLYAGYLDASDRANFSLNRRQKEKLQLISKYGAMRMTSPFRIFQWENPFNDSSLSYFFQSIGGYHAAKLRRYQDFIERVLNPERDRFIALAQNGQLQEGLSQMVGLRMLNTRYILFDQFEDPVSLPDASGFAWVAKDWKTASNGDEEIAMTAALKSVTSAVIHEEFTSELKGLLPGASGTVQLSSYQPDLLKYSTNLDADGLVMFSEVWYPKSWIATIDGNPVETIRANYVLRALKVPSGSHEVVWRCDQTSSELPMVANLFLLMFILGSSWFGIKKSKAGFIEQA